MATVLEEKPALLDFSYVIDKIRAAPLRTEPFRHIWIEDLFSAEHFAQILAAREITLAPQGSDEGLFAELLGKGYRIIEFPGCITNMEAYVAWHKGEQGRPRHVHSACEGFGVTLRLMEARSPVMQALMAFLAGADFRSALAARFGLEAGDLVYDAGVQKYLDGYEISPHPDIRKKALTYMVNVNPAPDSEARDHHTHYMQLVPQRRYVQAFWDGNEALDRCWVPWDWCETQARQIANNSMVIFQPGNDTLHAVKANYNHLDYQRTQLYGNFWYPEAQTVGCPAWEDLDILGGFAQGARGGLAGLLPQPLKQALSGLLRNAPRDSAGGVVEKRFYQK